jgi:hypothetical protein
MAPLQRLLAALAAATPADWSAAQVERMHTSILPAARYLAPTDGDRAETASDIKTFGKEKVVVALKRLMARLLHALEQGDIRDRSPAWQALGLLCALSDVLHEGLAAQMPPAASSSGRARLKDTAAVQFLEMPMAGENQIVLT